MTIEANKATARRFFEDVFNERNLDSLSEIVSPEYRNHAQAPLDHARASEARPPDGVEGQRRTAQWLLAAFPDLRIMIEDLIAEGEKVVVSVTARGTHLGDFRGLPPTGRSFEWKHIHILQIVDGKVLDHWAVRDDLSLMQQLGFIPQPTRA